MDIIAKCPFCGTEMGFVDAGNGDRFFLGKVNTNVHPTLIKMDSGIPVDVLGCPNCGVMMLYSPGIKNHQS